MQDLLQKKSIVLIYSKFESLINSEHYTYMYTHEWGIELYLKLISLYQDLESKMFTLVIAVQFDPNTEYTQK